MSLTSGFQFNSARRASLLAIRRSLFLLFFALLIFLFISAILASIHLFLFGGCSLRRALLIGSFGTLIDSRLAQPLLAGGYLIDLSFHGSYLLSLESRIGALGSFGYLIFQSAHLGFQNVDLCIQANEFLASLESLFRLCLSCPLVKGASNSGCLSSFSHSRSGSQVAPLGGVLEGDICGGRFGSQVDICKAGTGGGAPAPPGPLHASVEVVEEVYLGEVVSGPDVRYLGEGLLTLCSLARAFNSGILMFSILYNI